MVELLTASILYLLSHKLYYSKTNERRTDVSLCLVIVNFVTCSHDLTEHPVPRLVEHHN